MAHKEKIDYLLLDIRELEKKVASMRDAEIYPVSFFSQSFELAHKILTDLHKLEAVQMEDLSRQMEAHRSRLSALPIPEANAQPFLQEIPPADPAPKVEEIAPAIPTPSVGESQTNTKISQSNVEESRTETTVSPSSEEGPQLNIEKPQSSLDVFSPSEEEVQPTPEDHSIARPVPPISPEPTPTPSKATLSLNEILEKKNLSDFRKAFSLNDRFRFRRELFGGEEERMNRAISQLNDIHSYEESITFLHNELHWNIEDEAVADFLKLIEKRFL